jgi:predicted transcriptional regulator
MVEGPKKFFKKKKHGFKKYFTEFESVLIWIVLTYIAYKVVMDWWSWMDEEYAKSEQYNQEIDKEKQYVQEAYQTEVNDYESLKDKREELKEEYPKLYQSLKQNQEEKDTQSESHPMKKQQIEALAQLAD